MYEDELDVTRLKNKAKPSLLDKFMKENPKLFRPLEMQDGFKVFVTNKEEMSTDLACRNPIHDVLDQNNLTDVVDTVKTYLAFVCNSGNASIVPREILLGTMHRIF